MKMYLLRRERLLGNIQSSQIEVGLSFEKGRQHNKEAQDTTHGLYSQANPGSNPPPSPSSFVRKSFNVSSLLLFSKVDMITLP